MHNWVEASLSGDLDEAHRIQYQEARKATLRLDIKPQPDTLLPIKRAPAPPCPGFDRLDAIMSIEPDDKAENLATYKPTWSSTWAQAMSSMNEEHFLD